MEERKSKITIVLTIILILLGIFLLIILSDEKVKEIIKKDEYTVINNPSNFFTIEGCANKYIRALYHQDTEDILTLLNYDYKLKHNIDASNLYNYISPFKNSTTINVKKIYEKNENEFYIWGYLTEETIDSYNIKDNYYLIIKTNKDNNTFDITPYDGKIFKDKGDINE